LPLEKLYAVMKSAPFVWQTAHDEAKVVAGVNNTVQEKTMTKSELMEALAKKLAKGRDSLAHKDIELAVKTMLEQMTQSLATGQRIEIRGFGSFSLHFRPPRMGRNPKTGDPVPLAGKYVPHFKPGKELRERVNAAAKLNDKTS